MQKEVLSRCHEDHAFCRSCPKRCNGNDEPMALKKEALKTPTLLDRLLYVISHWAAQTLFKAQKRGVQAERKPS